MEQCKHCSGSGIYLEYLNPLFDTPNSTQTYTTRLCKYCQGKGWIYEEEIFLIRIPRKFIKDEYFK